MKHFKDSNGGVFGFDVDLIAKQVRTEHERKAIEAANEAAFQQAIDDARATALIEADAKEIELTEASEQALVDAEARRAEKAAQIEQSLAQANADASDTALEDDAKAEALALVEKLQADIVQLNLGLAEEIKTINDALPQSIEQARNQIEAEAVDAAIKNFTPLALVTFNEEAIQAEIDAAIAEAVGDKVEMTNAEFEAHVNPPLSPEQALINASEIVRSALQDAIDIKARELGFSGGNALMLYAGFSNPFQTLAQAFATWEATVWVEANEYKAEVIAGNEPMLNGEEAVALMPELVIQS